MEDLGELGFWLAVGIILAAGIVSGGRREREKEREKQETLRAMLQLEAEGKLTPETLRYMREKDAAEEKLARDMWGMNTSGRSGTAAVVASIVGILAFLGGLLSMGLATKHTESWQVPVSLLFGIWAGGLLVAFLIYCVFRDRKTAPPPGA